MQLRQTFGVNSWSRVVEHSFEARKGMNVVLLDAMWVL